MNFRTEIRKYEEYRGRYAHLISSQSLWRKLKFLWVYFFKEEEEIQ